ncbi:Gfo/Idh/MocA family protein [Deinococcus metalli]
MVQAGQDAGVYHAVVQNRRYDPNIRRVRQFVESGRLGDLTALHADFFIGAHFGGFRDAMQHVLLLDMAIHTFDAARLICGQDPVRVHCHEWNPAGSWYAHGANAVAVFEMTGGVVFTYRGSWCAEGFPTTWESEWRVIGTQGTVRWDGGDHPRAALVTGTGGFHSTFEELELPAAAPDARTGGHEGLIRDAVRALRTGNAPETIASDNIKSLAMVLAAIRSAETGQAVDVTW